jgi:putative spermidine/putrescine transport system ATP-binding protein
MRPQLNRNRNRDRDRQDGWLDMDRGQAREETMGNVVLEGIGKTYADCRALDGVDLSVEQGEFMTLLGASGSGKTTLLNVIAGMIIPDEGRVLIDDKDMTWVEPRLRGLGMVFQSYALVPHMTVMENIAFPLKIRRMRSAEIERRVAAILELVQLGHLAQRKPRELSGGQQQRVAIARCLVYEPPVILMDEPLGALDKKLREQLQREIRRIHRESGITIIYVTHDQEEALYLSDRICLMRGGKIEQLGTPAELYFGPRNAFTADFLGESNLLECVLESAAHARLASGQSMAVSAGDPADVGSKQQLLVRPDRIAFLQAEEHRDNEISGVVEELAFVGEVTRYSVRTGDRLLLVKARPGAGGLSPGVGCTVRMGWEARDALMLRA